MLPVFHMALGVILAWQPVTEPKEPTPIGPEQALAIRLEQHRLAERVIPTVVIVEDAKSYLDAISAWDGLTRFPVLWDDGSLRSRADIARFVHGFEPESVVRFQSSTHPEWPAERAERVAQIESALFAAVFNTSAPDSMRGFVEGIRSAHVPMVGMVLTDPDGAGWAGALALAAGHMQPLGFMSSPGAINGRLTEGELGALEQFARQLADALGLAWSAPIDEVDALTIAMDCPVKVQTGGDGNDFLATTDAIGRTAPGSAERWAWAGQLVCTDESNAVYQAMCSLFLAHHSAWIFDSYPIEPVWDQFDGTLAAQKLIASEWDATVFDVPRNTLTMWRAACARGVDASLMLVNTMGNADFFRLGKEDATPGDVPLLKRPAAVHFVHSFSAAKPGAVDTVAGRWVEHGVYAYLGSVQEPQLAAFVATPTVAERLAGGFPFGCAVRQRAVPWKLALLGDPLATLHATGARAEGADLPLAESVNLLEEAKVDLSESRFAAAILGFAMSGDQTSAARLAGGVLRDRPDDFDAAIARAALLPLFHAGKPEEVIACFARLNQRDQREPLALDAIWHAGRLRMYADKQVLNTLRQHLRPGQEAEDAIELADAWSHTYGGPSAVGMLQSVRAATTRQRDLRRLDRKIRSMLGGG